MISNNIFRKNIEIDDINKSERYVVAKISTSDLDKQRDIITPEALELVYKTQQDCCMPANIEHKSQEMCGRMIGKNLRFEKNALYAKINFFDDEYGDKGISMVEGGKSSTSIEGKAVKITKNGLIKNINSFILTGVAITDKPANPNAKILELHKSFVDIFASVKSKKEWKDVVSEYVLDGYIDMSDAILGQWFEFFKQENFDIDKIDSVFGLFPAYYRAIEDDLFIPMIASVKNIVATKTTDLTKSETQTDMDRFKQYLNNK